MAAKNSKAAAEIETKLPGGDRNYSSIRCKNPLKNVLPVVNLNARQKHLNNQEPTPLVRLIIIIIIQKLNEVEVTAVR